MFMSIIDMTTDLPDLQGTGRRQGRDPRDTDRRQGRDPRDTNRRQGRDRQGWGVLQAADPQEADPQARVGHHDRLRCRQEDRDREEFWGMRYCREAGTTDQCPTEAAGGLAAGDDPAQTGRPRRRKPMPKKQSRWQKRSGWLHRPLSTRSSPRSRSGSQSPLPVKLTGPSTLPMTVTRPRHTSSIGRQQQPGGGS